jgi:carboxyl-terminal processing protease
MDRKNLQFLKPLCRAKIFILLICCLHSVQAQQSTNLAPSRSKMELLSFFSSVISQIQNHHITPVPLWKITEHCTAGDVPAAGDRSEKEALDHFAQVLRAVSDSEAKVFVQNCLSKALAALGPYNQLLEPHETERITMGAAGIGVVFDQNSKQGSEASRAYTTVATTVEDSPADIAGVLRGDVLETVNGKSVLGLAPHVVIGLLRGDDHSWVDLTLRRGPQSKLIDLKIQRRIFQEQQSAVKLLGAEIGYVAISTISDRSVKEVKAELTRTRQGRQQPFTGLILDLRYSQGGLYYESLNLAAFFLPSTALIAESKSRQNPSEQLNATAVSRTHRTFLKFDRPLDDELSAIPMVVLIGPSSAAGAEIVAAALQDHGRAKLIGEKSFGKGSIEAVLPLPDSRALKVTIGEILRVSKQPLEGRGVVPDEMIFVGPQLYGLPRKAAIALPTDEAVARAITHLKK